MAETDHPPVEQRDVAPRALWLLGAAFTLFIAVSAAGLLLFFSPDPGWLFRRDLKPEPVLQISPESDYEAYLAIKRAELLDRGWVDRDAGLVEIPIGEAMRLVSQGYRAEARIDSTGCTGAACPGATPTAKTIP